MLLRDGAGGARRSSPRARAAAAVGGCRAASTRGQLRPWARGRAPRREGAAPGRRAAGFRGRGGADRTVPGLGRRQPGRIRTQRGSRASGSAAAAAVGRVWTTGARARGNGRPERAGSALRPQPPQRAHAEERAVLSARRAAGGAQALPAPSVRTPAAPPALPLPPSTRGPRPAPGGPRVLLPRQRCPRRPERAGPGQRAGGWRCWTWPRREWPCSASCSSWCCG